MKINSEWTTVKTACSYLCINHPLCCHGNCITSLKVEDRRRSVFHWTQFGVIPWLWGHFSTEVYFGERLDSFISFFLLWKQTNLNKQSCTVVSSCPQEICSDAVLWTSVMLSCLFLDRRDFLLILPPNKPYLFRLLLVVLSWTLTCSVRPAGSEIVFCVSLSITQRILGWMCWDIRSREERFLLVILCFYSSKYSSNSLEMVL